MNVTLRHKELPWSHIHPLGAGGKRAEGAGSGRGAVATWSSEWNYGPGWDRLLLDAYGIAPDPDRTRYYRLLYDLGP
jgi:hypothetical protein